MSKCNSPLSDVGISERLPRYTEFDPLIPVWCATPTCAGTIHRFFDTSPFSPSGRYLVSTQLPFEDRRPAPGDAAWIVLTDLESGHERHVAETKAWDTQVGAHPQWGADDSQLYFNDLDTHSWRVFGVRFNPQDNSRFRLGGSIYAVSQDGRFAISPCVRRTGLVQAGYGAVVPHDQVPRTVHPADDDGVFITDLESGKERLLISMRQLVESLRLPYSKWGDYAGELVGFHMNWNPQADRILFILRWVPAHSRRAAALKKLQRQLSRGVGKLSKLMRRPSLRRALPMSPVAENTLIVMKSDGSEPRVVVSADAYAKGGHHPNWCADGRSILMNLNLDGELRFVRFYPDEQRSEVLGDQLLGSGHPTLHPNERFIVTDTYEWTPLGFGDGTVPIRFIDWRAGTETVLLRIATRPKRYGSQRELRIDPHPAWDREFRRIAFNANPDGTRRVYVADLTSLNL
jgi:hypothetical protein